MKTVYIVHAVDTEGPLHESLSAKFERIEDIFKVKIKNKNIKSYKKFLKKEFVKNGSRTKVSEVFNAHLNNYNDSWEKINQMISELMSKKFRNKLKDSFKKIGK